MLRLGIDSRDAFAPQPRGAGKALATLLEHLLPLLLDWEVTLYTNRDGEARFGSPVRTRWIDLRGDRINAWERVRLPVAAICDRLDLLHCPGQTAPPFTSCPVVLTVHDLIPMKVPGEISAAEARRFERALARTLMKAQRIITVSEYTRNDLVSTFRISPERIDVVKWGVYLPSGEQRTGDGWERFRIARGLDRPFFVAFGGGSPRKNVPRILEAFTWFARDRAGDVQLVLVGAPPHAAGRFTGIADDLGISKQVVVAGYLPDDVVSGLLMHSEALVYPSLYEGFGLPILEAMAMGTPVITSNVTSMPEIAGDAAILVDPTDSGSIAEAMRACCLDESMKAELRGRGLRRAESFSWERTAQETLASYCRAMESVIRA